MEMRLWLMYLIKVRSYWNRMGPSSTMISVFIGRGKLGHRHREEQGI